MSVPPRPTERSTAAQPAQPAQRRSDKLGLTLVWIVAITVLVAAVLLAVL